MKQFLSIRTAYEDDLFKISCWEGGGRRALISFTDAGFVAGKIDAQREQFFSQRSVGALLWITDKTRSWGNNLDLDKVASVTNAITDGRKVFCIGNSMGGFLAILMSRNLHAARVLSFVPQWSICPTLVPDEHRWMDRRQGIKRIIHKDLSGAFDENCHYAILAGNDDLENIHNKFFRALDNGRNIELCQFPNERHEVAAYLKSKGILPQLIGKYFEGGRAKSILADCGEQIL